MLNCQKYMIFEFLSTLRQPIVSHLAVINSVMESYLSLSMLFFEIVDRNDTTIDTICQLNTRILNQARVDRLDKDSRLLHRC